MALKVSHLIALLCCLQFSDSTYIEVLRSFFKTRPPINIMGEVIIKWKGTEKVYKKDDEEIKKIIIILEEESPSKKAFEILKKLKAALKDKELPSEEEVYLQGDKY